MSEPKWDQYVVGTDEDGAVRITHDREECPNPRALMVGGYRGLRVRDIMSYVRQHHDAHETVFRPGYDPTDPDQRPGIA